MTLKVCKVAGPGIVAGTPFTFTVGSSAISVPAGAAPAGTCVDGPSVIEGTNVTVTETIPAGDTVSSVTLAPPGQLVSTNLATGTAIVTIGSGLTEVTYTNTRDVPQTGVTGCLKDTKAGVRCNPDGTYTLTLSGAGFTGNEITLTSETPGVSVTPPQQPWAATTSWTLVGATPGQIVKLAANATQIGGGSQPGTDSCCSGEITITMPECPKPPPVDVKIAKTAVPTLIGLPAGTHWFDLTVTNAGAAFNYPAGTITVTDNIPAGMTVTSATGTGWLCLPPTVVGPNSLTCTYTPSGTLAASGSFPPILVKTTTTGPGPFENCATVGLSASSGLVDTDPANNTSCVSVRTAQICAPPLVPGPVAGQCVCPAGTTLVGRECIKQTTCLPPLVPGAIAGQCVCPAGTVQRGRQCITPPTCLPPLVPGAVAGQCVCPQGTIQRGRQCVTPPTCLPPMVPGPVAGQCVCPQGTIQRGGKCVRPTTCLPPMVPGAVAGQCVCPSGTVQRGRECVRPTTCLPPMVPGAVAGQCVCPSGTVQRGRECVRQITCQPPMVSNAAGTGCTCPQGTIAEGNRCVQRERPQQSPNFPQGGPLPTPGGQQNGPRGQQPGAGPSPAAPTR